MCSVGVGQGTVAEGLSWGGDLNFFEGEADGEDMEKDTSMGAALSGEFAVPAGSQDVV